MPDELNWNEIPQPDRRAENELFERMQQRAREQLNEVINRQLRRNRVGVAQVLDTLGIELESLALSRETVARILSNSPLGLGENFRVSRDGSSEINVYAIANGERNEYIRVSAHTPEAESLFEGKVGKVVSGYELISVPMDIETTEMTLHAVLPSLECNGDFISERCATHIHVGGMKNLNFLKNCLKLGLWFDEVFYSLAHVDGSRFRGYSNNAIYARPLINGPYFRYNRTNYQILNWERALDADNLYEFFACYGINVENGEPQKYQPGRYFSINLFSIPRIGTVEFRHFNQTFNPFIVTAIAKLCQLFIEVSIKARRGSLDSFQPGDVFKLQPFTYYTDKLNRLLELSRELECDYYLDTDDIKTLYKVMRTYKGIGIENKEVLTHCRDFEISSDIIEAGKLKEAKNKPCPDGHTDIHNIRYSSII